MPTITGARGRVCWAYVEAAILESYTLTREGVRWRLTGRVTVAAPLALEQRPLTFEAPHQSGVWRWPVEALDVQDGQLSATLGPPRP